jgi:predicted dinucleotide-binding enzyme
VGAQIGILGTGDVARFLGRAWAAKGHQVALGTRNPEQTRARGKWAGVDLPLAAHTDLEGEVFVNSTRGDASLFNTMAHEVMVDPAGLGQESTIFVAGNDDAARRTATELAAELGWTDVVDLGDLTAARGLEMYIPLWLRIYGALGRPEFNIKVIR